MVAWIGFQTPTKESRLADAISLYRFKKSDRFVLFIAFGTSIWSRHLWTANKCHAWTWWATSATRGTSHKAAPNGNGRWSNTTALLYVLYLIQVRHARLRSCHSLCGLVMNVHGKASRIREDPTNDVVLQRWVRSPLQKLKINVHCVPCRILVRKPFSSLSIFFCIAWPCCLPLFSSWIRMRGRGDTAKA